MERNRLEEENLRLQEIVKLQDQRLLEKVHHVHDDHDRRLYSHNQKDPESIDSRPFIYISGNFKRTIKADHILELAELY